MAKLYNEPWPVFHKKIDEMEHVSSFLILVLNDLEDRRPGVIVHRCWTDGDGGYHGKGMAADIHHKTLHCVDLFLLASRNSWIGGLGIYPRWNNPGIHLDVRPCGAGRALWGDIGGKNYVPLTWDFMRKHCGM